MFATVDYHGTRFLHAYLEADDIELPAGFRSSFPDPDLRVRVLPNERNLHAYARQLLKSKWMRRQPSELMPVSTTAASPVVGPCYALLRDRPADRQVQVDRVRLEVWGIQFDPVARAIDTFPIRRVEVSNP